MIRHVRRSFCVFFSIEDAPLFDLRALLDGRVEIGQRSQILALSPLTESSLPLDPGEVLAVARIPVQGWTAAAEVDLAGDRLETLTRRGVLVSDGEAPELARLRRLHDQLRDGQWHPYAVFYHFMTRSAETELIRTARGPVESSEFLEKAAAKNAETFVEQHGPPPPAFHQAAGALETIELPRAERTGELYAALARRRTARAFDSSRPLALDDFTTLLYYTFGCQAQARLAPNLTALHKTSPSGGSLHPIEAYPLVLHVETLSPGFYHYDVGSHSLSLLRKLGEAEARELAVEISSGQAYTGEAHALVVLAARFARSFWKYRRRSKAYLIVHMDAAHLSQTFYLLASELGLGAFFSGAVDAPKIEEMLGLEPQEQSALALCGCGLQVAEGPDLGLEFRPYTPGRG